MVMFHNGPPENMFDPSLLQREKRQVSRKRCVYP